jgi:hypothetical protein
MIPAQQRFPMQVSTDTAGLLLARQLMRRIEESERPVEAMVHALLSPIGRRLQRHPGAPIREATLAAAARQWRMLPSLTRVKCRVSIRDRRNPLFCDLRLWAGAYAGIGWDGGPRPALMAMLIEASVMDGAMTISATPALAITEHCLVRRYQRGERADDEGVLCEISQLALGYSQIAHGGEFSFAVAGGAWAGHLVQTKSNQPLAVARTFFDNAAPALAA